MRTTLITVVRPSKADYQKLIRYGECFGSVTRWTFSQVYGRGRRLAEVKREAIGRLGVAGRIWTGCRSEAKAAADGWREGLLEERRRLGRRLCVLEGRWEQDSKNLNRKKRNAVGRRKAQTRLTVVERDLKRSLPRVCFGGRSLLRQGRLGAWRQRRASRVFLPGESGKPRGNEVAQLSGQTLRLTLPRAVGGGHLGLAGVVFRSKRVGDLQAACRRRTPVSWRIELMERGKVKLCVTFEEAEPPCISQESNGAVAVDLNADHCAVVEVEAEGNRRRAYRLPLGKGAEGRRIAAKQIVELARARQAPVVIEKLDYRRKKTWLRSHGKRYARMLSVFACGRFATVLERGCRRAGIELRRVDPAWSSKLGQWKYGRAARLGPHHAASLVIGRRGLGMRETAPTGALVAPEPAELHGEGTHGWCGVVAQWLPRSWVEGSRRRVGEASGSLGERPRRSSGSRQFGGSTTPPAWLPLAARVGWPSS